MASQQLDGLTCVTQERKQLAIDLTSIKERLHRAGLHATAQRMDVPLVCLGFEMAGDLAGCLRYEATRHADTRVSQPSRKRLAAKKRGVER